MRFKSTPILLITLAIVFVPLVPRNAVAATDFVTILENNGLECWANLNPIGFQVIPDASDEVAAGMAFAAGNDNVFFRGVMRLDKAMQMGMTGCLVPEG